MREKAIVIEKDGRLYARTERREACASCRACQFGQSRETVVELKSPCGHQIGDEIELEVADGSVSLASIILYGVPLAALILGLFAGGYAADWFDAQRDAAQAICAAMFVAMSLFAVKLAEPALKRGGKFAPKACKVFTDGKNIQEEKQDG